MYCRLCGVDMGTKHEELRGLLTDAIVELCRKEAFYLQELRIEGTVCLVSDRSSVLITQISEQIGEGFQDAADNAELPILNSEQANGDSDCQNEDKHNQDHGKKQGIDRYEAVFAAGNGEEMHDEEEEEEIMDVKKRKMMPVTEARYCCPVCPNTYQFKHSLKNHMNKHLGKKPYTCKYCNISFTHNGSLSVHVEKHHIDQLAKEFQCYICKESFISEESIKLHFTWRHKDQPYNGLGTVAEENLQQDTCNEQCQIKQDVDDSDKLNATDVGEDMADAKKQYDAKMEGEGRDGKGSEGVAEIVHTFIKMLEGQQEAKQKAAEEDRVLQRHSPGSVREGAMNDEVSMASHSPGSVRDGALRDEISMVSHSPGSVREAVLRDEVSMVSHTQTRLDAALQNQAVSTVSSAMTHPGLHPLAPPISMWPGVTLGFPTQQFMQPSTSQQQLMLLSAVSSTQPQPPRLAHKGDPMAEIQRSPLGKFQCPFCEKTYNFKHTLKDHINKHMGKRPHVCKHCGDSFTHLASLCAHIKRRHNNEMPDDYQCEICHEKFMNLQSLKQHFTWRHKDVKFSHSMLIVPKSI